MRIADLIPFFIILWFFYAKGVIFESKDSIKNKSPVPKIIGAIDRIRTYVGKFQGKKTKLLELLLHFFTDGLIS
jgi:hypothetical protein